MGLPKGHKPFGCLHDLDVGPEIARRDQGTVKAAPKRFGQVQPGSVRRRPMDSQLLQPRGQHRLLEGGGVHARVVQHEVDQVKTRRRLLLHHPRQELRDGHAVRARGAFHGQLAFSRGQRSQDGRPRTARGVARATLGGDLLVLPTRPGLRGVVHPLPAHAHGHLAVRQRPIVRCHVRLATGELFLIQSLALAEAAEPLPALADHQMGPTQDRIQRPHPPWR